MTDNAIQCTVDLKKNRIRLHKETLRHMGNPRYVQFLVNEEKRLFAVHPSNAPFCGSTHKIRFTSGDTCIEIYSGPLTDKLASTFQTMQIGSSYHLSGKVYSDDGIAVFSIDTAKKIEQEVEL